MANYIEIGDRSIIKSGTSLALTIPSAFVNKNNLKQGDKIEVRWNGGTDLLLRAKQE